LARGSTLSPMFNLYREIHMKKTLVALAVLAASGASFAQVSLTGGIIMGYAQGADKNGNTTSGLGVDTASLDFAVSEDLGGGMKLTAHQGFDTVRRGSVIGGDTGMSIGTSAYTFALDSYLSPDTVGAGFGNVGGAPINGWDGRVTSPRSVVDRAQLTIPLTSTFAVIVSHNEVSANGSAELGLGVGAQGSVATQRANAITGLYRAGKLNAALTLANWDAQTIQFKNRVIASANYDFGVAKIGAGVDYETYNNSGTRNDALVSVGFPIGAVTLGAQWVQRQYNGTNGTGSASPTPTITSVGSADATYTGSSFSASYALSKTSAVSAQYQTWSQFNTGATANAQNSNLFEVVLSKSF